MVWGLYEHWVVGPDHDAHLGCSAAAPQLLDAEGHIPGVVHQAHPSPVAHRPQEEFMQELGEGAEGCVMPQGGALRWPFHTGPATGLRSLSKLVSLCQQKLRVLLAGIQTECGCMHCSADRREILPVKLSCVDQMGCCLFLHRRQLMSQ